MKALSPKDSGEYIVKNAKFISIVDIGIDNMVKQVNYYFMFSSFQVLI
jgi:hypothetical protein